jgi:1,5-anhydro-D-fructose reductase (1,5-anhydro-D-mannitol-forming)
MKFRFSTVTFSMLRPVFEGRRLMAGIEVSSSPELGVSACFRFANGLPGSGSWCFVGHESAKMDRIEIIGNKGQICFSVFTYDPIALHTERGREEIIIENPPHVQLPLIKLVVEHLQQKSICTCDSVSATSVNWVVDRILGKL